MLLLYKSVAIERILTIPASYWKGGLSNYGSFDAQFLQDHVVGGEVGSLAESSPAKVQVVGIGQTFHQAKLRCEVEILFGLLNGGEKMLQSRAIIKHEQDQYLDIKRNSSWKTKKIISSNTREVHTKLCVKF